eukprot:m.871681 g.871681  ORF g.871681 m.871681 type:complete len:136 (-) comp23568_c0_seq54:1802-2209(-)
MGWISPRATDQWCLSVCVMLIEHGCWPRRPRRCVGASASVQTPQPSDEIDEARWMDLEEYIDRSTHPMNRHVAQMVWDSRHGHSPDVAPGFTQTKFANAHQNRREYYFYHPPGRCADADMRNATSRGPGTTGCGR